MNVNITSLFILRYELVTTMDSKSSDNGAKLRVGVSDESEVKCGWDPKEVLLNDGSRLQPILLANHEGSYTYEHLKPKEKKLKKGAREYGIVLEIQKNGRLGRVKHNWYPIIANAAQVCPAKFRALVPVELKSGKGDVLSFNDFAKDPALTSKLMDKNYLPPSHCVGYREVMIADPTKRSWGPCE